MGRSRREIFDHFFKDTIDAVTLERGNWNDLVEFSLFREHLDQREQFGFRNAVNFIEQQKTRALETLHALDSAAVSLAEILAGVEQERHDVHRFDGGVDFAHHLPAERGFRAVHARRVDQDDLRVRAIDDALNPVARGLRARRDDSHFFSDQAVDERRFSGVGPAYDRDISRLEFLRHACMITRGGAESHRPNGEGIFDAERGHVTLSRLDGLQESARR